MRKTQRSFVVVLLIAIAALASVVLTGCDSKPGAVNVSVQPENSTAAQGLDLQAIGGLLGRAKTAQQLEDLINDPSVGVNNLDLNNDGKTDYIGVREFNINGGAHGFTLIDESTGNNDELANITVQRNGSNVANVSMSGNPDYYGPNQNYNLTLSDWILLNYLFSPHVVYVTPYHYGYYPMGYRPIGVVPYASYTTRTRTYTTTTRVQRTTAPASTTSAPKFKPAPPAIQAKSLANPTNTQKQLKPQDTSRGLDTSGFKKSSSGQSSTGSTGSSGFGGFNKSGSGSTSRPSSPTTSSRPSFGGRRK